MAGTAAKGTLFKIGTTTVGQLTSIGGIELSAETIDVTDLGNADGYREFVGGFKDGGEVALAGWFKHSDAGQAALYTAFESGAAASMSIVFPAALSCQWNFNGVVVGYRTNADLEDAVGFESTVKVSGKPALTASA